MPRHRGHFLPTLLAVLVLAGFAANAEAATTLTVNCTFTVTKDVHIAWSGSSGASGTATITWPIGAATLGSSYSTVGTGNGWPYTTAQVLSIANGSLTGDGVDLSLTASSTGWTTAATTGTVDQFVAACTSTNTPPADTAAVLAAAGAVLNPTNAGFATNIAAGSSSAALWFAITVPTSITTGGGAKTVSFVFTGTAH